MANRRKKDIKSRMRQKRAVKHRSAHVRKIRRSDLVLHRIDANSRVSNLLRTQYGRVEYGSDPDNDIINGIRIGILQIVDGRPLLRAYAYNTLYPLDSAEAKCLAYPRDHTPDQVPHRNCSCGFWSLNSVDKLLRIVTPSIRHSLLFVRQWGRVIEGANGTRSQFMGVEKIVLFGCHINGCKTKGLVLNIRSDGSTFVSCGVHAEENYLTSEELQKLLGGIEVEWGYLTPG